MAHRHSIHDTNMHFTIDPVSRAIANQVAARTMLMQFDHNSERLTFELPRSVDGHDMTECDKVEIHYINVAADKSGQSADVYRVDDMQVSPNSDDVVIFSWLISGNATKYAGLLSFLVRFTCLTGETIDYAWHTDIYSNISVGEGMNLSEAVLEEYSDILKDWERRLGLPFVTDADNGKVMKVVGGVWTAAEMDDPAMILPDENTPNGNLVKWDAENKKLVDAQTSLEFFTPERVVQKGQFLFVNTVKGSQAYSTAQAGIVFPASSMYDGADEKIQDGYAIIYDPKTKTLRLGTGMITHSKNIYTGEGEIDYKHFSFGIEDTYLFENESEDEAIATRDDDFTEGHIPQWDATRNMFVDSGKSVDDIGGGSGVSIKDIIQINTKTGNLVVWDATQKKLIDSGVKPSNDLTNNTIPIRDSGGGIKVGSKTGNINWATNIRTVEMAQSFNYVNYFPSTADENGEHIVAYVEAGFAAVGWQTSSKVEPGILTGVPHSNVGDTWYQKVCNGSPNSKTLVVRDALVWGDKTSLSQMMNTFTDKVEDAWSTGNDLHIKVAPKCTIYIQCRIVSKGYSQISIT